MSDPEGLVSFDAGGEKYTAVMGFRAMKAVEAHYDLPFFRAIQRAMPQLGDDDAASDTAILSAALDMRMTDVGVLLRCALLEHHRSLTEDEVDDLIDEIGLARAGAILGTTLGAALVVEDDDRSPADPPKRRRKGKTG
jgi:hypothetical protein